jgi:(2R)-3-sulfolactate dehydrogenase (NADP+)
MTETVSLSLSDVSELTRRVLLACGTTQENAEPVVASVVAAEADGIHSHGLARLPTYAEHVLCGKVDGAAVPVVSRTRPGAIVVDAACGFAHPAIDRGMPEVIAAARECGVAAMSVTNSYNCGVVGYHVERLAESNLLALAFVNGPAAIAPWGGKKGLFGTDPIAIGCPRRDGAPMVIDQSSSVIAKSEVMVHAQKGEPIPEGWAFDADGNSTTDAAEALKGTMAPTGGRKGANLAILIELMAAGLSGSHFGFQASSFGGNEGGPPRTGQCFLAFDADAFSEGFLDHAQGLFDAILDQPGTRLPGDRRLAARERTADEGVSISQALHQKLQDYASRGNAL